jgi:tRNA(Ile)-lysidine synthase
MDISDYTEYMQSFHDTYIWYIKPDDVLVLAISWWVDSMALLSLVLWMHHREKIIVAHFDHSLRWDESNADRDLVANICKNKNIVFEVKRVDISLLAKQEKMSIESMARRERYRFLESVRKKYNAQYVLTAHHMDDQIETAIFNLIRGSKLGGIHALSQLNEYIFRPLISTSKREIQEYATLHNIEYREDSSNNDTRYLRNHIRHVLLPEFKVINPEYQKSLQDFINYTKDLKDWIDNEVESWLKSNIVSKDEMLQSGTSFSVWEFEKKSPFFQKEILRYLYEKANKWTIGLSEWLIEEILRYITMAEGGTTKWFWIIRITKQKSRVTFSF